MAGLPGIIVKITADTKDAIDGLNRVERAVGQPMGAFEKFGKVAIAAGAAIAGAFTLDRTIRFLQESAAAAMEDQKSMVALAKAMENVGLAGQNANVEAFIKKMSLARGVADDELRPALQRIITVTGDVATSQNALALAMDISAGSGRDLDSVTAALAKAYGGQTTALARLGVGLDANLLKSKDMDAIMAALSQKFEGQSSAAAETYTGKINRLNIAVQEAKETIGYELLAALDSASSSLGGVGGFSDYLQRAADDAAAFIRGVVEISARLGDLRFAFVRQNTPADRFLTTLGEILTEAGKYVGTFGPGIEAINRQGQASMQAARRNQILEEAMRDVTNGVPRFIAAMGGAEAGAKRFLASASAKGFDVAAFYGANPSAQQALAQARANVTELVDKYEEGQRRLSAAAGGSGGVADSLDKASKKQDEFKAKLDDGRQSIQQAIQAAKEYGENVRKSFVDALSLGDALDTAKATGASIVDEFIKQGERIAKFGENMRKLLAANLEKPAFDAIMRESSKRGADIAEALAQGNISENVRQVNNVYRSVSDLGMSVASQAAPVFGGAGVVLAQLTLENMIREFMPAGKKRRELLSSIDSMVAEGLANLARLTGASAPSISVPGPPAPAAAAAAAPAMQTAGDGSPALISSFNQMTQTSTGNWFGGIRLFADGGLVKGPTLGVVGESGPEMVVPLSQVGNLMSGGNTYNITVQAGVGDPRMIGEQIVSYVKRFEQASGAVWAAA